MLCDIKNVLKKKLGLIDIRQMLCYPLPVLLSFLDTRKQLPDGTGILVLAQKPNSQQDYLHHSLIDMVILPAHDWKKCEKEGFRTRDAHLIQHFEKNNDVGIILIIDRPTTLPEMVLKRRHWRVKNGQVIKRTPFTSLTKVSEKIYILDIFSVDLIKPLILKRDWWDCIFRRHAVISKVKEAISFLNLHNRILFLWSPLSTGVIGRFDEKLIVFDALDNWTKHPEIKDKKKWIERGYRIVKDKADILFTNSKKNKKYLENSTTHVTFIPNGVDKEFFNLQEKKIPQDIKSLPQPIIGYAGKIAKRIDVELLSFLAKELPKVSFVLIGQFLDKKWVRPLFKFKNIYFLGDKHYTQLPHYLTNFDICMIPHNVGSLENEGDPIKLYEYLAVGKPVVTTNIAGVDVFKDVITIAKTKEEFLEGIIYWLREIKKDEKLGVKLRNSLPVSCSWAYKADLMIKTIVDKLCEKKTT